MKLSNKKTIVEYDPESKDSIGVFSGNDLTDQNNLPAFYSQTRRTHKKAWAALKEKWTENTTMEEAYFILIDNGIKIHSWCRMD